MLLILACSILSSLAIAGLASASGGVPDVWAPAFPVANVEAAKARISAIIDPNGGTTSVHFEIGRTNAYGYATREHTLPTTSAVQVWLTIYGLAPSTTYHFRAVATKGEDVVGGPDRSFKTPAATGTAAPESLTDVEPGAPPAGSGTSSGASGTAGTPGTTPTGGDAAGALVPPAPGAPISPGAQDENDGASGSAPVLIPERSKRVVLDQVSGTVSVRKPGGSGFEDLTSAGSVPVGSVVDARHGVIELSASTGNGIDSGHFWGTMFKVGQPKSAGGAVELSLIGGRPARCSGGAAASAAASGHHKNVGGLWGKDHGGRFRTRGRNSVAAVRGTTWYVAERCAGTLTRVLSGAVAVRNIRTGRTVLVKAGHHLMVRDHHRRAAR